MKCLNCFIFIIAFLTYSNANASIHIQPKTMFITPQGYNQQYLDNAEIEIVQDPVSEQLTFMLSLTPKQNIINDAGCIKQGEIFLNKKPLTGAICAFGKVKYILDYKDLAMTINNYGVTIKSDAFGTILFQENLFLNELIDNMIPAFKREEVRNAIFK